MSSPAASLLGSNRCLGGLLRHLSSRETASQCQLFAAFSAQAQGAETASTSGRDSASSRKTSARASSASPKPTSRPASGAAAAPPPLSPSPEEAQSAAAATAAENSHLAPSRLALYAQTVLHRELMLKLGPRGWDQVPRLLSIQASIRAAETQLERDAVEKPELLLYLLALEILTGRPASFQAPSNKSLASRAAGVSVTLDARADPEATYGFLEKLVHVILPNQVGFEGVTPPTPVVPEYKNKGLAAAAAKVAAADHRIAPMRPHATEFKVMNLLQYPDFEQNFGMFEPLSGMRVRMVIEGASAADCSLLLSGLSLPVLTGAAAEAALAEQAAAQLAARRATKG